MTIISETIKSLQMSYKNGNWYIWWSDENKGCLDNIKITLNTIEADLDNKEIDIDILKIVRGKLAKIYLLLNKEKPY